MEDLVTLYHPTGPKELALVAASGWRRWPPQLPIFVAGACEAGDWNTAVRGAGFVTRFEVQRVFLDRYPRQVVGASGQEEYWIPAEDLEALNDAIRGRIEAARAFGPVSVDPSVESILLPKSAIEFGGLRPELPSDLDRLDLIEVACLTASLVSSLSEDYWCAGWLIGIGAESYRWAEATSPGRGGLGTLDEADLTKLARLRARLAPWWVEWVDGLGGVALVRASSFAGARPGEARESATGLPASTPPPTGTIHIAAAGNVEAPAWVALLARGYEVRSGPLGWTATGPLGTFEADGALSLLGLVALAESRGSRWQASDGEIEAFLRATSLTGRGRQRLVRGRPIASRTPDDGAGPRGGPRRGRTLARARTLPEWLGILDCRTFWIDPEEDTIEEFEYLMVGK